MGFSREEVLRYHLGGKVGMCCTRPLATVEDLCLAYTPGVAEAVRVLAEDPAAARTYSARGNLVAVVSDGTSILGLGDLGATASIPVMEGKAVLFKSFGDVDAWPVPLNRCRVGGADSGPTDPARVIDMVAALAPMYGGINLEDIAAPACFEIEDRLDEMLDIPVFHDDQWGTAVITLAGILNYGLLCDRDMSELRCVINGAGAAGIRIAEMLKAAGVRHVVLCDSRGIVTHRRDGITGKKAEHAVDMPVGTVGDALRDAHVFIGVSVADCIKGEDVRAMASYPAIFAMSNPVPEIHPSVVAEALQGKPYVMATGRSDFPNQINNVLGFPFLFRGALDAGARTINLEMKTAAARALAELARKDVPQQVRAYYPTEELLFGPGYLIPTPFDRRLFEDVSLAVAEAAILSGVALPGADGVAIGRRLAQRNIERL
ncbi:MAG: NAD(P)-dependent malic enzyme [Kiritimatiellia bacterium]